MITGDAMVTYDIYTQRKGPRILAGAATASSPVALASLDRLANLQVDTILTGHGGPWQGHPADAVARARDAGPA